MSYINAMLHGHLSAKSGHPGERDMLSYLLATVQGTGLQMGV